MGLAGSRGHLLSHPFLGVFIGPAVFGAMGYGIGAATYALECRIIPDLDYAFASAYEGMKGMIKN
jgi:hypothetical protein